MFSLIHSIPRHCFRLEKADCSVQARVKYDEMKVESCNNYVVLCNLV